MAGDRVRVCPHCGRLFKWSRKTCEHCRLYHDVPLEVQTPLAVDVRPCPHCGARYPPTWKACPQCHLSPHTLDDTRRYMVERIQKDRAEGVRRWEWCSAGEGECLPCAARDTQEFSTSELGELLQTRFCERHHCRCALGPIFD